MKIVVIGDVHGLDVWKTIVGRYPNADKIIFVGDYFDCKIPPWTISPQKQLDNFLDILQFQDNNKKKVVLLLGNHDYHYTNLSNRQYSGYDPVMAYQFKPILSDAIANELLKIIHIEGDYLFSHAGISKTWCENWGVEYSTPKGLSKTINDFLYYQGKQFEFQSGILNSIYGDEPCQGPLWIRPHSLLQDKIPGFIQIVGHTAREINIIHPLEVIFVDSLLYNQYLVIDNWIPRVETIRKYGDSIPEEYDIVTTTHWDKFLSRGYISVSKRLYCQHTGIGYWCKNDKMSSDSIFDYPRMDADSFAWKTSNL